MKVWILSYARSGSSFLSEMLTATGLFGEFSEYFNRTGALAQSTFGVNDLILMREECRREMLFSRIVSRSFDFPPANKVLRRQFSLFGFVDSDKALIDAHLPGLQYIHLKRSDLYARAVSEYFRKHSRKQTGKNFASITDEDELHEFMNLKIPFDEKEMLNIYQYLKNNDATGWENYLGRYAHLFVEFERLIENPLRILKETLEFAGADAAALDLEEIYIRSKTFSTKRPETEEYIYRLKRLVEVRGDMPPLKRALCFKNEIRVRH